MFWANTPKQVFRSEIYAVTKKYANFALICAHMATFSKGKPHRAWPQH